MTLEVRALTKNDTEIFRALRLFGLQESPQAFSSDAKSFAARPSASIAARLDDHTHALTFGAFLESNLVGIVVIAKRDSPKEQHHADVFSFYVAPQARGAGVGRALMQHAIRHAQQNWHVDALELAVANTQHAAKHLYENLGFVVWGVQPNALRVNGESVDFSWMQLSFISPTRHAQESRR